MAFEKGHTLSKGRPAGSKNKRTQLRDVIAEQFPEFDPVAKMVEFAQDDGSSHQFDALKEILSYAYPKLKQVELELGEDTREAVKIVWGKTK